MATDKRKTTEIDEEGEYGLLGLVVFFGVVALFLFVSTKAGTRGMGVMMLIGAYIQLTRGRIPYGIEGRPPVGYLTGGLAVLVNVLFAAIGVGLLIWPEVAMGIFGWGEK